MKRALRKKPASHSKKPVWMFDLYVAGTTPKSIFIFNNLKQICSEYIQNECRIRIIDLLKTPAAAKRNQIVALPTLVRTQPLPALTLVGDLSNTERVLASFYHLK